MKECKYCNFEANGDIPDDRLDLIGANDTIALPVKTDITINGSKTTVEDIVNMSIDVSIYDSRRTGGHILSCCLWSNEMQDELETEENPNGVIFYAEIEINYCPVCGRKLNKNDSL